MSARHSISALRSGVKSLLNNTKPKTTSTPIANAPLSTKSPTMAVTNSNAFFDAVRNRHTYYALNDKAPISDARIQELVREAVLHVPSAFNSQSARLVVLLGAEHKALWDIVLEVLRGVTPADNFEATTKKIDGFRSAYGSILFYEEPEIIKGLQSNFALYADKFPQWSEHTSAMHQFTLWTALEAEGVGANLQHYNPIIDAKVSDRWGINPEWSLKAQLVFGGKAGPPALTEKPQTELSKRLIVHGAKEE